MLSKERVEELISKKLITIGYSFRETVGGEIETLDKEEIVDPALPESIGYQMFNKNFKGDRLSITMGAIAISHKYKTLKGRINFRNEPYWFDLRKTDGRILIQPGEAISIPSNERIRLNDNPVVNEIHNYYIGAYIFPRLTTADAGLFYVPSYIDPTWDGLMQAVLYNFSDKPIEIRICERLAICRFYKIDGNIDEFFKQNFAKQNHHYAQNWENILEGSKEPVRRGKKPIEESKSFLFSLFDWTKIKEIARNNILSIIILIISGSAILSIGAIWGTIKEVGWEYPKTKEEVDQLKKDTNAIPKSKSYSFNIDEGKIDFSIQQEIDKPNNFRTIFYQFNNSEFDVKKFYVTENAISDQKITLTFNLELNSPLNEKKTLKIDLLFVN